MHGNGKGRTFTRTQNDAADEQGGKTGGPKHRELRQSPDKREAWENPTRRYAIYDEAEDDGGDGVQQEEGGAEQAKLLRRELKLRHDRHTGQADDDLIGEVDDHV